jgi:hemerythrin-like domain-containing protein
VTLNKEKETMKKQKRITNLDEKIFLVAFGKPRYKSEISRIIYGEEKKTIYPRIDDLIQKGWLEEIEKKPFEETDGRARKRAYLKGTPKPFFDRFVSILKEHDESLSKDEEKRIISFIDSEWFRKNCIAKDYENVDIDLILERSSYHTIFVTTLRDFFTGYYGEKPSFKYSPDDTDLFKDLGEELLSLWSGIGKYRSDIFFHYLVRFAYGLNVLLRDFMHQPEDVQKEIIKNIDEWYEKIKEHIGIED